MCGILLVVDRLRSMSALRFASGLSELSARGPDQQNSEIVETNAGIRVLVGHTHLKIVSESNDNQQPVTSKDGRYVLVLNGQIFNFRELTRKYFSKNKMFPSDAHFICELVARYGLSYLSEISGMFFLCIVDKVESKLYVVRDSVGIKPGFFFKDDRIIAFSSEIAPLQKIGCSPSIDRGRLRQRLDYGFLFDNNTVFTNVTRVTRGVSELDLVEREPVMRSCQLRINGDNLKFSKELVVDEIKSQVDVDGEKLGLMFSGGLDSTIIGHELLQANRIGKWFTVEFAEGTEPGISADARFAKKYGNDHSVDLHLVRICAKDFLENFHELIRLNSEPYADIAAFATYMVGRHAREKGCKVLLSGMGADELFGGYRRHWVARWYRAFQAFSLPFQYFATSPKLRALVGPEYRRKLDRGLGAAKAKPNHFVQALFEGDSIFRDHYEDLEKAHSLISLNKQSFLDLTLDSDRNNYLPNHNLAYLDEMLMKSSVEGRVPLSSEALLAVANQLRPDDLVGLRYGKLPLRRSYTSEISARIVKRRKAGFAGPLSQWLSGSHRSEFRDLLEDSFSALLKADILDRSEKNRIECDLKMGLGYSAGKTIKLIWTGQWLKQWSGYNP